MKTPHVSIVIPVYNVSKFLDEAIRSVLAQNYHDLEIVVVNDGSERAAEMEITAICSAYKQVRLIHQKNQGQALARRTGVMNARGDYIIFLDADDILLPGAVPFLVENMDAHPEAIGVYGRKMRMEEDGAFIRDSILPPPEHIVSGDVLPSLLKGSPLFSHGNICMRRAVLAKVDFPERIRQGEDWVTWCRLSLLGDIVYVGDRVLLSLRTHGKNVSAEVPDNPAELFKMFDHVFNDPRVTQRIGEKKLAEYRVIHLRLIHKYLWYVYRDRKQYFRMLKQQGILRRLRVPRDRIRVLHIAKWFYAGGAERIMTSLLASSDNEKFEHMVLSLSEQGERLADIQHTHGIPYKSFELVHGKWDPEGYRKCFDFIRETDPDVVTTWLPPSNIAGGIMAKLLGKPVIWGIHNVHPEPPYPLDVRQQTFLRRFIPRIVICCSQPAYDTCRKFGYKKKLLTLIENGTDAERFQYSPEGRKRIREELGISDDTLLIGMASEGTVLKRHPHFTIAAKLFSLSHPNAHFLFCGKRTAENIALRELVASLELQDRVHILGIRNDMADIYSALDVHTLNSSFEAFGLVVTEAMACKTLSVATHTGVMPELLKDVGITYSITDDPKSLVEAWTAILALPEEEKRARRERGRQRIIDDYSITRAAKAYDEIYYRALGRDPNIPG
ncbi:MAG: glycosyltransferase [Alphaproteobacteria bacterium]|nr:glycosyltransferase [Alphaproteobacteria bacterium]